MENSPDPAFERAFQSAYGYFQLGMWEDAWSELEKLNPGFRELPQVILLRVVIFNTMEKWDEAAIEGANALREHPDFGPLYLATAHALSRSNGAAAAKEVLLAGESILKGQAMFHFVLACYECELGDLEAAKANLSKAFTLDQSLRMRAAQEPDLGPLRDSFGDPE